MKLIGVWMDKENPYYTENSPQTRILSTTSEYEGSWLNDADQSFQLLAVIVGRGRLFPFSLLVEPDQEIRIRQERYIDDRIVVEVEEDERSS